MSELSAVAPLVDLDVAVGTLEEAIAGARTEELPAIAGKLGRLDALLTLRLSAPLPAVATLPQASDRRLKPGPAAKKLERSTTWLRRHRHVLPFAIAMPGGRYLYSEQGIEEWIGKQLKKRGPR